MFISKHRFYLMWAIAVVVLMVIGTCNVAKAEGKTVKSVDPDDVLLDITPDKDPSYTSYRGYLIQSEYKYYFYKDGITLESEGKDFTECFIYSMRELIEIGAYGGPKMSGGAIYESATRNGTNPVYRLVKAGRLLTICMEDKGYILKEHKRIFKEEPQKMFIPKPGEFDDN